MAERAAAATLAWKRGLPGAFERDNLPTIDAAKRLIRANDRATLAAQLAAWQPEDIIDLMVHLPVRHARRLFGWLAAGPSHKVLAELRPEFRAILMHDATVERLVQILEGMGAEDAADTFDALPETVQERVRPLLANAEQIIGVTHYPRHTAGRMMTRRLAALPANSTASDAVAAIQQNADMVRKLDDVFALDGQGRPVGSFKPRRLLLVAPETRLSDIMSRDITTVSAETVEEDVRRIAARRDLRSVPVVDGSGRLIGQIAIKHLRQIARDGAGEDLLHMSHVSADAKPTDSIRRIVAGRLPWLLAGLIGATVAAMVIGSYEDQLEEAAIVAAFIPVVMSLAGNSGLQASAVTVQALSAGTLWAGDVGRRFIRELCGALINGAVAGVILAGLILLGSHVFEIEDPVRLAIAVSLALVCVTTIAAMVGAFVPMALDRMGIDPAAATGVFITTSNDVIGVLVFFTMAAQFYFD